MLTPREVLLLGMIDQVRDARSGADLEHALDQLYSYAKHVREDGQVPDPMPAGWNRPAPASLNELMRCLTDVTEHVEAGDSWEGFIQWSLPGDDEVELSGAEFGLIARYRVGNLDGQGGMRVWQP